MRVSTLRAGGSLAGIDARDASSTESISAASGS
jgi:hypothetical protein